MTATAENPTRFGETSAAARLRRFAAVRERTARLCDPLAIEDYVIQTVAEVSPPKWHLAHTTWFFEHFILAEHLAHYRRFHTDYGYLFNSYYEGVGKYFPRTQRGLLSRPSVSEILAYRRHVNQAMNTLLSANLSKDRSKRIMQLTEIGLQHEQQHQELLLMDIKYNFAFNPMKPAYLDSSNKEEQGSAAPESVEFAWLSIPGGLVEVGTSTTHRFVYDNEKPRHRVHLQPFLLGNRLVTNGEYLEFIAAGGYQQPQWWLADGWNTVQQNQIRAPLYWYQKKADWFVYTLRGEVRLDEQEPVSHVSYYEADAYARWRGARLPLEQEWEHALSCHPPDTTTANFVEKGVRHPLPANANAKTDLYQGVGDLWEWSSSPYQPYPGYRAFPGLLGEYNGKFMCNQMVLRGGCCVTPATHFRPTYRNFFFPYDRWAFSGIRLAKDGG